MNIHYLTVWRYSPRWVQHNPPYPSVIAHLQCSVPDTHSSHILQSHLFSGFMYCAVNYQFGLSVGLHSIVIVNFVKSDGRQRGNILQSLQCLRTYRNKQVLLISYLSPSVKPNKSLCCFLLYPVSSFLGHKSF